MHIENNIALIKNILPGATVFVCGCGMVPNFLYGGHAVSIDTRTIKQGDYFVALAGINTDGHEFLFEAITKGAQLLLVNKESNARFFAQKLNADICIIEVSDPLRALLAIAMFRRQQLSIPIIGITGSVGKTTTKEMVRFIFKSAQFSAYASFKNQNTLLGLAINLLKVDDNHNAAIFELGINHTGEMDQLVTLLQPSTALITNVGNAHREGLGDLKSISIEKKKIFKGFSHSNTGFICGDIPILNDDSYCHPIIRFGLQAHNQVLARNITTISTTNDNNFTTHFDLSMYGEHSKVVLQTGHRGYVLNALAAACLAQFLSISMQNIVNGLAMYRGFEARFEIKPLINKQGVLINDCYNASPESVMDALVAFDKIPFQGKKIVLLGDMLELGNKSEYFHVCVGRILNRCKTIQSAIFVGPCMSRFTCSVTKNKSVYTFADSFDCLAWLLNHYNDAVISVLVKGSLGMQLKNIVQKLT